MSDKLIVCSVVDGVTAPRFTALVQAWSVESLEDNLRRQRREMGPVFLPVATTIADPGKLRELTGLPPFPASVWLGNAAYWFGKTPLIRGTVKQVFAHLHSLPEDGAELLGAWFAALAEAEVLRARSGKVSL